jgi:two-component system sensor histidine kinase CpxA
MFNLHAKVFLGFWLAMLGIVGAWLLTDQYIKQFPEHNAAEEYLDWNRADGPPDEFDRGRRRPPPGNFTPPPKAIFRIHYALQNMTLAELPTWIQEIEQRMNVRILLFNRQGEEIFGAEIFPGSKEVMEKLSGRRRIASLRRAENQLFAQEIYRPDEGRLAAVVVKLPPRSPFVHALTQYLWLRLLLAVVFTGVISFLVSRYLTRPLKALQLASQQLAGGELDTRIKVPDSGGDETARLGRDFNSMADQLQQQIEAQKRLLRDVSHELRSPLARLRVALALAERDPDSVSQQLARIEHETERLDELIAQLLQLPEYELELEDSVDLVGLMAELCADAHFEARAQNKLVQFQCELAEAVLRTKGDLLKKAIENVIRNAVHYTPENSAVKVSLDSDSGHFNIRVCDQGEGAPESMLDKLFEPFFRVDEARTRATGGYGLGLSIAKQAVLKHKGSIQAFNLGSGGKQGLCIEIKLPAHR